MSIALIIPSRGLIHSRTIESLLIALEHLDAPYRIFFTHDLPIPDCFNKPLKQALDDDKFTHFVIVEEDILVPPDAFTKLLKSEALIATYDYALDSGTCVQIMDDIVLCGTGLISFTREALEQLYPFRVDQEYLLYPFRPNLNLTTHEVYGKHDIDFCYRAHQLGIPIDVVGKTGHYRVIELGRTNKNEGYHRVIELGSSPILPIPPRIL